MPQKYKIKKCNVKVQHNGKRIQIQMCRHHIIPKCVTWRRNAKWQQHASDCSAAVEYQCIKLCVYSFSAYVHISRQTLMWVKVNRSIGAKQWGGCWGCVKYRIVCILLTWSQHALKAGTGYGRQPMICTILFFPPCCQMFCVILLFLPRCC